VREAESKDLPELLRMLEDFAVALGEAYEPESIVDLMQALIKEDHGIVLTDGKSCMAGAVAMPYFFNANRTVVTELFWWVDEDQRGNGKGKELLEGLEAWARSIGADRLSMMTVVQFNDVGKLYEKHGFKLLERTYAKDI
jgi:N-acetylglutamate synthase-like GNAT family acetyltransferase